MNPIQNYVDVREFNIGSYRLNSTSIDPLMVRMLLNCFNLCKHLYIASKEIKLDITYEFILVVQVQMPDLKSNTYIHLGKREYWKMAFLQWYEHNKRKTRHIYAQKFFIFTFQKSTV